MASITIQKHDFQSASRGQIAHIYRENENYKNRHIDVSKSDENILLGEETAAKARARLRQVLTEIDTRTPPQRIRADRKTVASLVIPAPRENLTEQQAMKFFETLIDELQNAKDFQLIAGAIHADEIHEYIDPADKKVHESRLHMHLLVVPDLPDCGCNMKKWLTKARYKEMNALADRACERALGYTYQDGTRQQTRGSVEALKEQSLAVQAAAELEKLKEAAQEAQETAQKASEAAQEAQNRLETIQTQEKAAQSRLEALQKEIDALEAAYSDDKIDDIQRLPSKKKLGGRIVYELSHEQMKALESLRFKVRKQNRDLEAARLAEQSAKAAQGKALAAYQREYRKAEDYEKSYINTLRQKEALKTAISRQPERVQEIIFQEAKKALQRGQSQEQGLER